MKLVTSALFILLLGFTSSCSSQEKISEHTYVLSTSATSPSATIDQAAWLSGEWIGVGLGGHSEEYWSNPMGGHMTGAFRFFDKDKLIFSEHMDIAERDGSLSLRLKHFDADLKGWEEKEEFVEFPLVRITKNELNFQGLTYKKIDETTLEIYIILDEADPTKEEKLTLKKTR